MELAKFENLVALHAPDASSVVVEHVVRQAIVRFMRESQVAVDTVCFETQCGVPEYPVVLPECRQLVSVTGVTFDDPVEALWRDEADPYAGGDWNMDEYHPVVILRYTPKQDGKRVVVRYTWAISRDGCDVPDAMYECWGEAVKWGALADLFSMPKQEWSSPADAMRAESFYQTELQRARNAKWHNYSRRAVTMAGRPFLSPRR